MATLAPKPVIWFDLFSAEYPKLLHYDLVHISFRDSFTGNCLHMAIEFDFGHLTDFHKRVTEPK